LPLLTDDLNQARRAYDALEARARNAEARADIFQTTTMPSLQQRILDLEGENIALRTQIEQLASVKADLPLQRFIDSIALAAALGEASMPERAIPSIKAEVRTYLAPGSDGIGVRFQQPELAATPNGLSSTSFEIVKVPPQPGVEAPANVYVVLQETQRVYSDPFWLRFGQSAQIVAAATKALANVGAWNAPFLVHAAADLAQLQDRLVPIASSEKYSSAVGALRSLTDAQNAQVNFVAADIYALSAALAATVAAARAVIP
jgi:hypothetical protein